MPLVSDFFGSRIEVEKVSLWWASFLSNQKQIALLPSHDSTIIQGPLRGLTRTTSPGFKSPIFLPPLLRIRRIVDRKSDVITKNLNSDVVTSWDSVRESFRSVGILCWCTFAGVFCYIFLFEGF